MNIHRVLQGVKKTVCDHTYYSEEREIMDAETAIAEALAVLGFKELKEKQKEAVMAFVQGHDTFVALPTGYGKSIIYAILPLVFDKLKGMK